MLVRTVASNARISKPFVLMFMLMLLLCLVRACWRKPKIISQSLSTSCLQHVNHVLTEHKYKCKKNAYAYVLALLTSLMFMIMFASEVRTGLTGTYNRSQITSKRVENKTVVHKAIWRVSLILPHSDILCDLLPIRRTTTWSLLVVYLQNAHSE